MKCRCFLMFLATIGGSFLTQVPTTELESGVEMEKMSHEPIGLLDGAIGSTFRRLECFL